MRIFPGHAKAPKAKIPNSPGGPPFSRTLLRVWSCRRTVQAGERAPVRRGGATAAPRPGNWRSPGLGTTAGPGEAQPETLSGLHSQQPGGQAAESRGDHAASFRSRRLRGPWPGSPRPPDPLPRAACTTRPQEVTGLPGCASTSCLARRQGPGVGAQRARLRGARARGSRSRRHFHREVRARFARRRAYPAFPWQRGACPCGQEQGKEDQRALGGGTAKHPPAVELSRPPRQLAAKEEKQPSSNRKGDLKVRVNGVQAVLLVVWT